VNYGTRTTDAHVGQQIEMIRIEIRCDGLNAWLATHFLFGLPTGRRPIIIRPHYKPTEGSSSVTTDPVVILSL